LDILKQARRDFPNCNFDGQRQQFPTRKFGRQALERHIKNTGPGKTPPRRGNTPGVSKPVTDAIKATAQRVQVVDRSMGIPKRAAKSMMKSYFKKVLFGWESRLFWPDGYGSMPSATHNYILIE
jgi:hypothetical protein